MNQLECIALHWLHVIALTLDLLNSWKLKLTTESICRWSFPAWKCWIFLNHCECSNLIFVCNIAIIHFFSSWEENTNTTNMYLLLGRIIRQAEDDEHEGREQFTSNAPFLASYVSWNAGEMRWINSDYCWFSGNEEYSIRYTIWQILTYGCGWHQRIRQIVFEHFSFAFWQGNILHSVCLFALNQDYDSAYSALFPRAFIHSLIRDWGLLDDWLAETSRCHCTRSSWWKSCARRRTKLRAWIARSQFSE